MWHTYNNIEQCALHADFPTHDIWFVTSLYGPTAWCSKPKDMNGSTLIMYHPDDLRHAIKMEIEQMIPERVEKLTRRPGNRDG